MRRYVLENLRLFDGLDGQVTEAACLAIEGEHIAYAGAAANVKREAGVARLDLGGAFVMPGMTDSHAHLSYSNAHPAQLDRQPLPIAMLDAVDNAHRVLSAGFTSAISFGSAQGIDLPLREVIDSGRVPGPRLLTSDRDVGSTGSNADGLDPESEGRKLIVDGPWAVRAAVRSLAKKRIDIVKIFLDGEMISAYSPPGVLTFTDDEVAAAVDESHARGMRVAAHARSAPAVKQALRHRVDLIGHANYLDDEAVEMLGAARDRIFVGPAIAWEVTLLERGDEIGLPPKAMAALGYQREIDETISAVKRMREAGVRILPGGDYGLSITPHGTQARELSYFVELFGMTPVEALLSATRDAGAAFDPAGSTGTLEAGKLADLVVVDGDPTADVRILEDPSRILAVLKSGKRTPPSPDLAEAPLPWPDLEA